MPQTKIKRARPSDRLLDALSDYEQILVVMHDNPDPDAIASGWAVQCLIEEKLNKEVRLIGGGAIVRAENRHMVDLLGPPVQLVLRVNLPEGAATILVDCGLGTTNQLLTRDAIQPVAVVDHHQAGTAVPDLPFVDVRPDVAASATIAASYLREQDIEPGPKLATALMYAIRTETHGCEFHFSPLDDAILLWLTERADPSLLAEIESAPLSRKYFSDLALALQSTVVCEDAALCVLPQAEGPEIVGEVADLLVRCRGLRRVLCGAVVGDDLHVSARTELGSGNATKLLQKTLDGLGGGGGHEHRAGGKIPHVGEGSQTAHDLEQELRRRWFDACSVGGITSDYLIARHEIVENL